MPSKVIPVLKTGVKVYTVGKLLLKSAPMFHRVSKTARPLWVHMNKRGMWSKGEIPIQCRSHKAESHWDAFGKNGPWPGKDIERWVKMIDRYMPKPRPYDAYYVRPRCEMNAQGTAARASEVAKVKYDKSGFEVQLDVKSFEPADLQVKVSGNRLVVEGKHEQKLDDHGLVSREFKREFEIPEDVNLETLETTLSEEGFLTIQAELEGAERAAEKKIEIKFESNKDGSKDAKE